uniref:Uncharacterized protein n=1 Tax=Alexandrium andersonii TaxID=327968 RepID=A0A7S2AEL8_9DINO
MTSLQRAGAAPDAKAALQRMRVELPTTFEEIIANFDHGSSHTYRGFTDNAGTILRPLPFRLQDLAALTEAGCSIAITSSDDDTTNPPAMQRWFQSQVPGSSIMRFSNGWGHLHGFVPEHFERTLSFLMTGRDSSQVSAEGLPRLLGAHGEGSTTRKH